MLVKNYDLVGIHWGFHARMNPAAVREAHQRLLRLYREKRIEPLIYREFPLEEAVTALELLAGGKTWGKLVIRVAGAAG